MEKRPLDPRMPTGNNDPDIITVDKIKKLLPKGTSHLVSDEIINMINNTEKETGILQEYFNDSFLTYLPVLKQVSIPLEKYVNAIRYCNLKRMMSNEKAWEIVFPHKHKKLIDEGRWNASHVSMYNQSALVVKLDAQMMIGAHIQYMPYFHKTFEKQFNLMNGIDAQGRPVSAHVQHLAASKLYDMTKPPEDITMNLKIDQSDDAKASTEKMLSKMSELASNQQKLLEQGYTITDIQKLNFKHDEEFDDEAEYADLIGEDVSEDDWDK